MENKSEVAQAATIKTIEAAVGRLSASKKKLEAAIWALVEEFPEGTRLGDYRIREIRSGASQWGNRTWDVETSGLAIVLRSTIIAHDGRVSGRYDNNSNWHSRSTEEITLACGSVCDFAVAGDLRDCAKALPALIAARVEEINTIAEHLAEVAAALEI
jgi:hypothetical protein